MPATRQRQTPATNRRNQIPDLVSIHVNPPEIEEQLIPGYREVVLIIGANTHSAVGTLVERTTRLVILAKVDGTTATAAAVGFSHKLNEVRDRCACHDLQSRQRDGKTCRGHPEDRLGDLLR
ncbi:hypothetical protein [Cobetia amphilecti]|uniref:hypothetical protein n=1 Tax=Cobetia amphilecti TaxID=1055104 RepID=UPI00244C7C49|nr:hypothetical protein [Cobetia litoralis]MDH2421804.1 hypothetical protein [Cobetia litoralis]